jgi:hypothetical protein
MRIAARLLGLAITTLLFVGAASAQSKIDLFAGYSYARTPIVSFIGTLPPCPPCGIVGSAVFSSGNANGWELTGVWKTSRWIGVAADFDGHYASSSNNAPSIRQDNFLFGPQISAPTRISPFAHVLFGVGHAAAQGLATNTFVYAIGGGLDYKVASHIAVRFAQVDYYMTHYAGHSQNEVRISTGIVLRF